MKKYLKLLFAFALVFVLSLNSVKAQEEPGGGQEEVVQELVTTAPVVTITGHNNSLILSWEQVENATRYVIQRSTSKTKGFKNIATVTTTSYQNKSLKYGSAFYYRVIAYGPQNYKVSAVVGRKVVPNKVVNVTLTPYSNQMKITWNKTSNHGYYVYRSVNGTKWVKIATIRKATTVAYVDKKLASNRVYYYQVKAFHKVGKKEIAGVSSGVFSMRTAPAAPKVTLYSNSIDEIKINVKAVAGAQKYQIYEYNEATKKWEFGWNAYPEWFTNNIYSDWVYAEKPYHYYYYRVRACSDTVCGTLTTVKAYARLTTGNIEVIRGENKAVNIYIAGTYGAQGYEVYRATAAKGKYTRVGLLRGNDNTHFRDTKVSANKTYYYRVRSFMKIGSKYYYSPLSAIRTVKTGANAGYLSAYEDAKRLNKEWYYSKQGMINTLVEYYGYNVSDATNGVNKCNINFKSNALKLTQEFLSYTWAIAEEGVRTQLQEALFTEEEIEYVLANITLDWHQQLTDAIQSMLAWNEGYGRGYFIRQFTDEYSGFTEEQVTQVINELNIDFQEQCNLRMSEYALWEDYITRGDARSYLDMYGFTEDQIEYTLANYQYDWSESLEYYYNYIENYDGYKHYYSKAKIVEFLTGEGYEFTDSEVNACLEELEINFNEYALHRANTILGEEYLSAAEVESRLVQEQFTGEEIEYALANIEVDFNFNAYVVLLEKLDQDNSGSRSSFTTYLDMLRFTDDNITYALNQISTERWIELAQDTIEGYMYMYNTNNGMGLSESGITTIMIDQFYFTAAEVSAALENMDIDFARQALYSASSFIASGTYSKESLINLLVNSGFTTEDATQAASSNTIDYGEECVEYINSHYIGQENIGSLENIVSDLGLYGFSESEINYAVEKTGLEAYIEGLE